MEQKSKAEMCARETFRQYFFAIMQGASCQGINTKKPLEENDKLVNLLQLFSLVIMLFTLKITNLYMDPSPVVRAIDWLAAHAARESDPTHNTLRLDIKFLCVTIHKSFEIREIFFIYH